MSMSSKIKTLAKHLSVDQPSISCDPHGQYTCGDREYLVLTDEEADKACADNIRESLWAFKASFILDHVPSENGWDDSTLEALLTMQEKLCESANPLVLAMIGGESGLPKFVKDAIAGYGRGHFLSGYDGKEVEEGKFFIYRTN
jgi:hypothetical protein